MAVKGDKSQSTPIYLAVKIFTNWLLKQPVVSLNHVVARIKKYYFTGTHFWLGLLHTQKTHFTICYHGDREMTKECISNGYSAYCHIQSVFKIKQPVVPTLRPLTYFHIRFSNQSTIPSIIFTSKQHAILLRQFDKLVSCTLECLSFNTCWSAGTKFPTTTLMSYLHLKRLSHQ